MADTVTVPLSLTYNHRISAITLNGRFYGILTMVYSTQSYWGFGLFPSSGVLGSRNTTFWKLDLFPSSGEGGKKTPTQLGPLERANLNFPVTQIGTF
jgi:hypothetical protein